MTAIYDSIGVGYANHRKPDRHIAAAIEAALGDAQTVVNIGAGAGSYESAHRHTVAVEPSATMIAQRPPGSADVIQASAEDLPFPDKSFDAATAFLTTHHWSDLDAGLREMRRVARGPCVFLDHAPNDTGFWLIEDYFPELRPIFRPLLPLDTAREVFGQVRIVPIPVPHDCTDGFFAAYWRRPEAYLDPSVRRAISIFAGVADDDPRLARLRRDLKDGIWMARHGHLMHETAMDYGYRLIVAS
ncbi:MAG TPA: class I SAM-dependent methyltransferase [Rhizomicrobium sp.]|nr:class I SAM-dependent methyltransferase [Rhizomicrobium sp.]